MRKYSQSNRHLINKIPGHGNLKEKLGWGGLFRRIQKPKSVMVWAGICGTGKSPVVFVKPGVKINQVEYLKILKKKVLPWSQKHFKQVPWVFQQDSAPKHRAITVQEWCSKNFPDFITWKEWPPSSPDLNPMDFSIWNILQERACKKPHKSLRTLKSALIKEWSNLELDILQNCCLEFMKRVKLCIKAKGQHFEKN